MGLPRTVSAALRRRPFAADLVVAAILTLITWVELAGNREAISAFPGQVAAFTAVTAAVGLRRRAPMLAVGAVAIAMTVQTVLGEAPVVGGFVALLVVLYPAGAHLGRCCEAWTLASGWNDPRSNISHSWTKTLRNGDLAW